MMRFRSLTARSRSGAEANGASRAVMVAGLGAIVLFLSLSLFLTYAVLEVKTSLRAYVSGEGLWSKGTEDAIYFIHRYIDTGDDRYLALARDGLAIPLGDRRARQALEASPPAPDAARDGFIQGGNHPEDVARMTWLFQHFSEVAHFKRAVMLWREADTYILQLEALLDTLEVGVESTERLGSIRQELIRIREKVRPLEEDFSATLGEADRWLNEVLFSVISGFLLLTAVIAMVLFWWAARRLSLSERELRATLENAGVGMALIHNSGRIRSLNSRLCEILGRPAVDLNGMPLSDILSGTSGRVDMEHIRHRLANEGRYVVIDEQYRRGDGSPVCLRCTFNTMGEDRSQLNYYVLVVEDISKEYLQMNQLAHEASHDPLTGLPNRREFRHRLSMTLEAVRSGGSRHALCYLDLDRFKEVNDSCGHSVGDGLLVKLGGRLRAHLREGDVLARIGGDEFAVIFGYCPFDVAESICERLRREVEGLDIRWEGQQFSVSLSMGLVELGPSSTELSYASAMEAADRACYEAKRQGGNRVRLVHSARRDR